MKKIRVITIALILAIVVSASSAVAVIHGKSVDPMGVVEMKDSTSSTVSVCWEEVDGVDGYKVYGFDSESGKYKLAKKIIHPEECSYEFKKLLPATQFRVKVIPYKIFNKKEYTGEASVAVNVYTYPDKGTLKASSPDEGQLVFKWTKLDRVKGYELQYSKSESFSNSKTKSLASDKAQFSISKLAPKDIYYSRIRSYINVDGKNIYGQWSDVCKTEIKDKIIMSDQIDPNKPIVALSFDDGPAFPNDKGNSSTKRILNVLEKYGARATFFMCASRINDSNKDYLKREIALGCEIGNHTYDHTNYGSKVTANDISKNSNAIKKACGQAPTIFRCPGGMMSSNIQAECEKEGMPIAYWSVDTEDWKSKDPKKICNIVDKYVYDGSIILMHDIYPTTADAVEKIVPMLIEKGYQVVTVSEMLAVKNGGKAPKAGCQYIDYKTINNNT